MTEVSILGVSLCMCLCATLPVYPLQNLGIQFSAQKCLFQSFHLWKYAHINKLVEICTHS